LGEVIRIGTGVTVRVLEVKGNQVRLGLEAPPDVKILREEIYRAILKENEEAALDDPKVMDRAASAVRVHRRDPKGPRNEHERRK
jgi:carbon storage regulator